MAKSKPTPQPKAAAPAAPGPGPASASPKVAAAVPAKRVDPNVVVRIKRHIAGPPRRAPGQILRMTPAQIAGQKLKEGVDFQYVTTTVPKAA